MENIKSPQAEDKGNRREISKVKRNLRKNKKGLSIVISTIIIVAISITMAIAVSFWAMGISSAFTKFEKLEIISMWVSDTTVPYLGRPCYQISMHLKNTGTNTLTIINVYLDGKPWNAQSARVPGGQIAYQVNLIGVPASVLQTGQTLTNAFIYLPAGGPGGGMWNSGNYVAIEFETAAGRHYPYTVVIP